MRHRIPLLASFVAVPAVLAPALGGAPFATGVLQPRLTTVKELRRIDLAPNDGPSAFDPPGLELVFDLPLPSDVSVLEFAQPAQDAVHAADSTGHDLSGIEPGFTGDLEYVELEHSWGDDARAAFALHLALPARRADSFDLDVEFDAVTYSGTERFEAELTEDWVTLDTKLFGTKVEARLAPQDDGVHVMFRPGTIRSAIEDLTLFRGDDKLDSGWSMWNDTSLSYAFEGRSAAAMRTVVVVRTGLRNHPVRVRLEDQPLP